MSSSTPPLKKDAYETLKTQISFLKETFDLINALFKSRCGARAIVDLRKQHGIWKNKKAFRLKRNEQHELFTEDYYERWDRNPNIIKPGQIVCEGSDHISYIDKEYFEETDWPGLKDWIKTFAPLLNESDFTKLKFIQGNPFRKIIEGNPEDITIGVIDDAERIINDEDLLLKLCKKWNNSGKNPEDNIDLNPFDKTPQAEVSKISRKVTNFISIDQVDIRNNDNNKKYQRISFKSAYSWLKDSKMKGKTPYTTILKRINTGSEYGTNVRRIKLTDSKLDRKYVAIDKKFYKTLFPSP